MESNNVCVLTGKNKVKWLMKECPCEMTSKIDHIGHIGHIKIIHFINNTFYYFYCLFSKDISVIKPLQKKGVWLDDFIKREAVKLQRNKNHVKT